MPDLAIMGGLFGVLAGLGVLEDRRHRRHLARIPVRIHVNGTRGKSSVCRLIGAGLRAARPVVYGRCGKPSKPATASAHR